MKIISHRGNLSGPCSTRENSPDYIQEALDIGFDVEIDVWKINDTWYLGHDEPEYTIHVDFLKKENLWCHAKNKDALEQMLASNIHCFWHQEDDYTITSRGYIWAYPNKETSGKNTVFLFPERHPEIEYSKYDFICTDFVNKYLDNTN